MGKVRFRTLCGIHDFMAPINHMPEVDDVLQISVGLFGGESNVLSGVVDEFKQVCKLDICDGYVPCVVTDVEQVINADNCSILLWIDMFP